MRNHFGIFMLGLAAVLFVRQAAGGQTHNQTPAQPQRTGRIDEPLDTDWMIEDLSEGAVFRFEIASTLPLFTFKIIPNVQYSQKGFPQSTVQDIEVFQGDSDHPLQRLTGCDFDEMEPPMRYGDWFHTDDINFDGYQDIYLMTSWGATGNHYGCFWLFNPATGRFDFSKGFSQLSRYWLDPETKAIRTFDRGGMVGLVYVANQYHVEGNQPVLFWSEHQDWRGDEKGFHCVLQERRNGVMVTTRDVWSASTEPACQLPLSWFQLPKSSDSPPQH